MESQKNKELEERIVEHLFSLKGGNILLTKSFSPNLARKYGCDSKEISEALENLARTETEGYSIMKNDWGTYDFVINPLKKNL